MKRREGLRQDNYKENHPPSQYKLTIRHPLGTFEHCQNKGCYSNSPYRKPLADITHLYVNNKVPLAGLGINGHHDGHDGENGEQNS